MKRKKKREKEEKEEAKKKKKAACLTGQRGTNDAALMAHPSQPA